MEQDGTTRTRRGLAAVVAGVGAAALGLALVAVPAAAADGATLSRTSGPIGTTVKVSGTCTDLIDDSAISAKIKLYYPDAFDAPFSSRSEFHSVTVNAAASGAFSGSIKVGPAVEYTKQGPGPAAPGDTVLRKPKAGDTIRVQVVCTQLASPFPISYLEGTKSFTVTKSTFTLVKRPVALGTAKVGRTLTATKGTWSPKPAAYGYQWKRGANAIPKATKASYKLKLKDKGKKISVVVKAKKVGYVTKAARSQPRLIK